MARFDFVVDTNPMADSVKDVSNHINATTAAVVAMQTAVLQSEKKAADKICENVDSGFYNLIRSQISMKLATYFTEMNAKLSLMLEYSKALKKSKNRMESDFFRLKREYYKIFHGMDVALENRIAQIDRDALGLAETRKKVILGKFTRDVPETAIISQEVNLTEQQIISARIKSKTSRSLKFLGNKVHENYDYTALMDSLMEEKTVEKEYEEYIPVVYSSEQSMLLSDSFVVQLHFPDYLSETVKNSISIDVINQIDELSAGAQNDFEKQEVLMEFHNIVSAASLNPRVSQVMMSLFEKGGC